MLLLIPQLLQTERKKIFLQQVRLLLINMIMTHSRTITADTTIIISGREDVCFTTGTASSTGLDSSVIFSSFFFILFYRLLFIILLCFFKVAAITPADCSSFYRFAIAVFCTCKNLNLYPVRCYAVNCF